MKNNIQHKIKQYIHRDTNKIKINYNHNKFNIVFTLSKQLKINQSIIRNRSNMTIQIILFCLFIFCSMISSQQANIQIEIKAIHGHSTGNIQMNIS
jgi:hypothetical protein